MRERFLGSAAKLRGLLLLQGTLPTPRWAARNAGALLLALLSHCGDDVSTHELDNTPDAGATQAGAAANGGQGGHGGHGGRSGPAARGGAGSTQGTFPALPQLITVPCGTALCVSPVAGFGFITACCADEGTSTCGTTTPNGACMKPPAGDPRCPALNFRGIVSVPSCCTQKGACGLDGAMYGMPGCTDLESAAQLVSSMRFLGVSVPEPRVCDPWGAAHADAGVDDAGT